MNVEKVFKQLSRGTNFTKTSRPAVKEKMPDTSNYDIEQDSDESVEDFVDENHDSKNKAKPVTITLLGDIKTDGVMKRGRKRKRQKSETSEEKSKEFKQRLQAKEQVNQFRNSMQMKVIGNRVPEPIENFCDLDKLGVETDLLANVTACGYTEPTNIQRQAMPVMLLGRHMLACAPTGSGKTAAFLLPIIHSLKGPIRKGFRAVILCPTRELAKQTQKECLRLSTGRELHVHVMSNINKALKAYKPNNSNQNFDILVTTPNRLCFLLKQDPPAISLKNVEWLVVDEADKLFEDSDNGFREQLQQVLEATVNENRKVAMFSATSMPTVENWCRKHLSGLIRITVGHRNTATSTVKQKLLFVGNEAGKLIGIRDIIRSDFHPPMLIFVQSKERAQQLYTQLANEKVTVDAIHGDRTQSQRDATIKSFCEGNTWVLICTELMARGIDFKDINLVVNYDFPTSVISYVHRVGRAGRAGRTGEAVTFFTVEDKILLRKIGHIIKESGGDVPDYILKMKKTSKKDLKQLKVWAPKRDSIRVKVQHKTKKQMRFKRFQQSKKQKTDT